jgi:hypothetical protein
MAETHWGRGGTHGYKTNTRGAFYYSCSGHGGYVIDGRCLTEVEHQALRNHIQMPGGYTATEIVDDQTQKVVKFRGPENYRSLRYYRATQTVRTIPILFAEEDCDWAVLEFFTDIRILGHEDRDHLSTIKSYYPEIRLCPTPNTPAQQKPTRV